MNDTHRTNVCNVLVIGSGAAGLRAAIAAHISGCEVVVVGKRLKKDAHTVLASGGINAALSTVDPEDSWQQHFADTLVEGYFLGDPLTVEILTREAPQAVMELTEWGCPFARLPDGRLDQRFFGAHKYRRTCYAGDHTGRAMLFTLADQAAALGLEIHENQYVSRLLVHDEICFGAMAFDLQSGERTVYLADAVILAAGGHTRIWRRSTSRRDENTGDGFALALEAGASLSNMELVQFHPTGMVTPDEMAGTLVTEAVRGEGGRLHNSLGERFMQRYDPQRMELSTRDRVALANYTEIVEGRAGPNGGVFLDISHRDKNHILEKLPRMYRQFMESLMLDISRQPMEVAPTAHYSMGGVIVEPETHATSVVGLYAAGEVTSGVHGANRLGGNSLVETLVFGRRAGEAAAEYSHGLQIQLRNRHAIDAAHDELNRITREGNELARPLQRALRNNLWENCGVLRDEQRLRLGLKQLAEIIESTEQVDVRPSSEGYKDLALALDLRGSLVAAEATLRCALERRESRGAQQRSDYPEMNSSLLVNFCIRLNENGEQEVSQVPVQPTPEDLQAWVKISEDHTDSKRLLE
jgi:succinate dehydrogenase / fumarate reductase, flavoprotein subunit